MNKISKITKKDIINLLERGIDLNTHINIFGELDEIEFLGRLYDLKKLPSKDSRFNNLEEDIYQHRYNNLEWASNWFFYDERFQIFTGDDDYFLKFICEIFHPEVRDETGWWNNFFKIINEKLRIDGYELYEISQISKRSIYYWRLIESIEIKNPFNKEISLNIEKKLIGEGSYAQVFKYKDPFYDVFFALKKAKKELKIDEIKRFKNEFTILKQMNSPYIIKVFSYLDDNSYVMEYIECNLKKYLSKNQNLQLKFKKNLGKQLINSIKYINSKGIFHRDISPLNILVKEYDSFPILKLADFGLIKSEQFFETKSNTEIKGSFNDPSLVIDGFKNYNLKHELYSLTFNLVFLLTGTKNISNIKNASIKQFANKGMNNKFKNIEELENLFLLIK